MRWRLMSLMVAAICGASLSAGEPAKQDARGKKLYNLKCAKCHEFYEPSNYSHSDWQEWMGKMKKKSHLNATDYDLVLRYTEGLRAQHKGPQ
jgi:cytochrome c5